MKTRFSASVSDNHKMSSFKDVPYFNDQTVITSFYSNHNTCTLLCHLLFSLIINKMTNKSSFNVALMVSMAFSLLPHIIMRPAKLVFISSEYKNVGLTVPC